MRYFANPTSAVVRDAMSAGLLGAIVTPEQRNVLHAGVVWCADNGCFGSGYPGDEKWLDWLTALPYDRTLCAFAVAPDVVGDAAATLARSRPFLPKIRALGYPAAYVAQDGHELLPVPWGEFDVLFIGGTTEFKLGPVAREMATEARRRGLRVHMGRVNSLRRLRIAAALGCESADGTYIAFGPNKNLARMTRWLQLVQTEAIGTP